VLVGERGEPGRVGVVNIAGGAQLAERGVGVADLGVVGQVVSEMLGHATIALTLDTYSHVIPSLQQEAVSVVAAAVLDRASTPPQAAPKGQVRAITSGS
jgi:hypothetical protein